MIPLVIFLVVTIIGILVYFLVIKKKSEKKIDLKKINLTRIKCKNNQVLINDECKDVLSKLDCKSESPFFLKLDDYTKNTSCTEMRTYEKINYCDKIGKVFYDNRCMIKKSEKDCQKVNEFSKPDKNTRDTSCTSMTLNEKMKYCKSNNKVFHQDKCQDQKSADLCPINEYLKPDPKTNFTTCTKMSSDEIKKLCKKIKKVFKDDQCIDGVTIESCKLKFETDEPLFYLKPNSSKTKCVKLSDDEKFKICTSYGREFKDGKCSCGDGKILLNGQCLGMKTKDQCFNEIKFSKPNKATGNSSCIPMNIKERKDYCKEKNMIYLNNDCKSVLSKEDCEKNEVSDKLFKQIPDKLTGFTSCRNLTPNEKEKICLDNDRIWDGFNCLIKLGKPKINLIKVSNYNAEFEIKVIGDINLQDLIVEYTMDDPCECKDSWIYKQKEYKGCSSAPDNNGIPWCYVKGNSSCGTATKSSKNEKYYRDCSLKEDFVNTENFSENLGYCLDGIGGKCFDNIDKKQCLSWGNNKRILESEIWKGKNNFSLEFKQNIVHQEGKTCEEYKKVLPSCKEWLDDLKKVNISEQCQRELWLSTGCKLDKDKKISSKWSKTRNLKQLIRDNYAYRFKGCVGYGIQEKSKSEAEKNIERKKIGSINIIKYDEENNKINVNVFGISQNTKYKIRMKLLTNKFGFESPFSDFIHFKTKCNSKIYTRNYCRNNKGPENTTVSTVKESRKDRDVKNWPFFKVPKKVNGEICGCRELNINEAKQLCINTYFPNLKDSNVKVIFENNQCILAPFPVGPTINNQISNLEINQKVDNSGKIIDISDPKDYLLDKPFRVLINWSRPKLNQLKVNKKTIPLEYKIYRKELESGSNFTLIETINLKSLDDVKILSRINFYYLDENVDSSKIYFYKIIPINSAGEGEYIEISIKTKEKRISNSECNEIYEDKSDTFDGFQMSLDVLNNKCISMSTFQRNKICENQQQIEPPHNNIYDPTKRKCVPLTNNLKFPGKPMVAVLEKTSTSIKLSIIPPTEYGIPSLTDYILKWKNIDTNETGRLTHGSNYKLHNVAGSESFSNSVYVKPHPSGLNLSFNLIHKNLKPASNYEYMIEAISFNDNLWNNYTGNLVPGNEDSRLVGKSEVFTINVQTDFSIPLSVPKMSNLGITYKSFTILINKFDENKKGGRILSNMKNSASIKEYKIKRIILPSNKDKASFFKSDLNGEDIIIDLNNISNFNDKYMSKKSIAVNGDGYKFIDYTLQPLTNYRYYLFAKNNRVNEWSVSESYIDINTPDYPPFYECSNPKKFEIKQSISNIQVNRVNLNITWDKSINPNIERYKSLDIFRETEGYPKYDLILSSSDDRREYLDLTNNFYNATDLFLDTKYTVRLKVRHRGIIRLSNGMKFLIETSNEKNLEDEFHKVFKNEKNIKKPLIKKIKTLEFKSDEDCKQNDLYYDRNLFNDNKKIPFYLDKSYPRKCVSRKNNFKKLTEYCQKNVDQKSVYWFSTRECKIPKDGEWIEEQVFDKVCTKNGIDGNNIICGGAKIIGKKYIYKKPETDLSVQLFNPDLNGKDVDPPNDTTEYLINGKRIAYSFESCSNISCKNFCKKRYGQLQDEAYFSDKKEVEIPLSLSDINDNTYCKKDAKQSVNINLPSEVCPKCGNPNKEEIKRTWTCIDGFAGKSEITKCKKQSANNYEEISYNFFGDYDKRMNPETCKNVENLTKLVKDNLYLTNDNDICKGNDKIFKKILCEKAAKSLKIEWKGEINNSEEVFGCFTKNGNIYFNKSGKDKLSGYKSLCLKNEYKSNKNLYTWGGESTKFEKVSKDIPLNNMTKDDCYNYSLTMDYQYNDKFDDSKYPKGCISIKDLDNKVNIYYNNNNSSIKCGEKNSFCIVKNKNIPNNKDNPIYWENMPKGCVIQNNKIYYNHNESNKKCNPNNLCVSRNFDDINIKDNLIEEIVKEKDRIEGKWYKCYGSLDTVGNSIPHSEYKNVSYCNPPFLLQASERKDKDGKNIVVKRNKYFMQKTKKCQDIPYCEYQKTKDRFPAFTNYCGEQTVSTNKVCIGPDGNQSNFENCGVYNNSGDYKLTKTNKLSPCKDICEGPPNTDSLTSDGYDKWESYGDNLDPKTEEQFKRLCKAKTFIKPKYYTKDLNGRGCGGCGSNNKKKIVYDVCEDGMYDKDSKTKCQLNDETKDKYNSKVWSSVINENVDCDSSGKSCKIRKKHISKVYSVNCPSKLPNCDWKIIKNNEDSSESKCSAYCNGGTKYQNVKCFDKDGNETSKSDCGIRPTNMWESAPCNTDKCSDLCTSKGNKWIGSETKPYNKNDFDRNCEIVDAIPRVLHLDTRSCSGDMKGCGLRNLRKYSFCIDGIGKDQKLCKEYIDNDKSGRTWIKKVNKTSKFYDSNKDCNSGSERYKDNYEECHDLEDSNTWDIVKSKRNEYYSIENIDCTKTGQGFLEGNEEYCKWIKATENDSLDCQGTVFRTYKCVDDSGKTVTTNRCNLANKPTEKVVLGLTCDIKPSKWMNNTGVKDSAETACNVCGVVEGQILSRNNKCIRSDGVEIGLANCTGEMASVKQCNQTEDCKCKCENGETFNKNECNSKLGFSDIKEGEVKNICKSCNYGFKLTSDPVKIPYFDSRKFKFSKNLKKKCKLKLLESEGSANEGIKKGGGFYPFWYEYFKVGPYRYCSRKFNKEPINRYGIDGKYTKYWRDNIFQKYLLDDNIKGIVFSKEYVPEKATYSEHVACNSYRAWSTLERFDRDVSTFKLKLLKSYKSPYIKATAWGITNDCFDESKEEIGERKFNDYSGKRFYTHVYQKKNKFSDTGRNIKSCKKYKCLCENGNPVNLCDKDGTKACKDCNDGYYLFNKKCVKNKNAKCSNGTPAKGNNLLVKDNIESCQKCDLGYSLSKIKKSTKFYNQEEVSTNIRTDYDPLQPDKSFGILKNKVQSITRTCFPNQARCKIIRSDGTYYYDNKYASKLGDPDNVADGIERCSSCPQGWTLRKLPEYKKKIQIGINKFKEINIKNSYCYKDNKCSCPNGTAVLRSVDGFGDSGCPIGAKFGCKKCNNGYILIKNHKIKNSNYQGSNSFYKNELVQQGPICIRKNSVQFKVMDTKSESCKAQNMEPLTKTECDKDIISKFSKDTKTKDIFNSNRKFKSGKTENNDWSVKGCSVTNHTGKVGRKEDQYDVWGDIWPKWANSYQRSKYYLKYYSYDKTADVRINWKEGDEIPNGSKHDVGSVKYKHYSTKGSKDKNCYKKDGGGHLKNCNGWGYCWIDKCHKKKKAHDRKGNLKVDLYGICKGIKFPADNQKTVHEKSYTSSNLYKS